MVLLLTSLYAVQTIHLSSLSRIDCLYEAPLMMHRYGLDDVVCRELGLENPTPKIEEREKMVDTIKGLL